jgi:hypothetical protein
VKADCGYFGADRHPRIDSCRLRLLVYVYWACNIVMAWAVLITFAATIFPVIYVHLRHYKALKKRCCEHSCKIESARTSAAQARMSRCLPVTHKISQAIGFCSYRAVIESAVVNIRTFVFNQDM